MKMIVIKATVTSVTDKKHRGLIRKHRVTNDRLFAAYVQMAKDYPATIETYL